MFIDSKLTLIATVLTPIVEVVAARELARSLLDTYVGPRTGAVRQYFDPGFGVSAPAKVAMTASMLTEAIIRNFFNI